MMMIIMSLKVDIATNSNFNPSWPGLPELHKGLGGGADLPSH